MGVTGPEELLRIPEDSIGYPTTKLTPVIGLIAIV
jgi:hypothetical protein